MLVIVRTGKARKEQERENPLKKEGIPLVSLSLLLRTVGAAATLFCTASLGAIGRTWHVVSFDRTLLETLHGERVKRTEDGDRS